MPRTDEHCRRRTLLHVASNTLSLIRDVEKIEFHTLKPCVILPLLVPPEYFVWLEATARTSGINDSGRACLACYCVLAQESPLYEVDKK